METNKPNMNTAPLETLEKYQLIDTTKTESTWYVLEAT